MLCIVVGRAILPWGPLWGRLSGGFFGTGASLRGGKGRLKAGCSQDWLPHNLGGMVSRIKKYAALALPAAIGMGDQSGGGDRPLPTDPVRGGFVRPPVQRSGSLRAVDARRQAIQRGARPARHRFKRSAELPGRRWINLGIS